MAMDKKAVLIEAIKKLLALRVPENEIIVNLGEIGVSTEQARQLIEEAKKEPLEEELEKKVEQDYGTVMMDVAEKLAQAKEETEEERRAEAAEEISSEFPEEEEQTGFEGEEEEIAGKRKRKKQREPLVIEKRIRGRIGAFQPKPVKTNIERLWEKGILTTINQKLNEMKELKEEIDRVMQKKLEEAFKSELERIKIAFESQRALMVSQAEEKMEERFKEATFFIDQKLVELKTAKTEIAEAARVLEEERKKQKQFLREYEESLEGLKKARDTMLAEMNSELIRAKSNAQAAIDAAETKIGEIDERVNKTLELEASIAEGLMKDAEDKIEALIDEKTEEVRFELQKTLNSVQALKEEIEKTFKRKIELTETERKKELEEVLEEEIEKIKEFRNAFEKQMEDRLKKLDKLYSMLEKEAGKKRK